MSLYMRSCRINTAAGSTVHLYCLTLYIVMLQSANPRCFLGFAACLHCYITLHYIQAKLNTLHGILHPCIDVVIALIVMLSAFRHAWSSQPDTMRVKTKQHQPGRPKQPGGSLLRSCALLSSLATPQIKLYSRS